MIELAALREYRVLIRANTARSSRCDPAAAQAGFTLIEIMVAFGTAFSGVEVAGHPFDDDPVRRQGFPRV